MVNVLVLIWLLVSLYTLISFLKPLPPFRTRKRTLVIGVPIVFVFLLLIGIAVDDPSVEPNIKAVTKNMDAPSNNAVAVVVKDAPKASKPIRVTKPDLDIAALTHFHGTIERRVTYKKQRSVRLYRDNYPDTEWTIQSGYFDVICFEDGNNAVITGVDGIYYAQNGKAKQFTRFEDGDGMLSDNDKVIQINRTGSPLSGSMHSLAIAKGFEMCPAKSIEEISKAVRAAMEDVPDQNPKPDKPNDLNTMKGVKAQMDQVGPTGRSVTLALTVRSVGRSCNSIVRELHVGSFDQSVWYAVECDTGESFMVTIAADGNMNSRVTDCATMALLNIKCFQKIK